MILSAENIGKAYALPVLRNCSLSVSSGQCLLIRGVSGGGKSTLLRTLALLERADQGTVKHGDRSFDASRKNDADVFPFLTVVFQQIFLWPHLTMGANLTLVTNRNDPDGLPGHARALLSELSIETLLGRYPHQCSLGQRQRLAVARAILSKARFLLLDEPSSALDFETRKTVVRILAREKATGRGLLIVTHDERDFQSIADESLLLHNGGLAPLPTGHASRPINHSEGSSATRRDPG